MKTLLITGASSLGIKLANYFKNDYNIILTYNKNNPENKIRNINNIEALKLDITDEENVKKTRDYIKSKYKHIDLIINNAALSLDEFFEYQNKEDFMKVLETNIWGTFSIMREFINFTDTIVNISSTDSIDTGSVYNIEYSISKAGINTLTKYMADFNKDKFIYAILPNWINTDTTKKNMDYVVEEMKRIGQKELIEEITICRIIEKIVNNKEHIKSGSQIRINEGDNDE